MNLLETLQRIEKLVGIDLKTKEIETSKKRMFFLTGMTLDGIEERYSIYDCSGAEDKFDMYEYQEMMENEEGISTQIIIFRDWDHERELFWEVYDKSKKAKEKNLLYQYFTKKISVYTQLEDNISLNVEEKGINYLEYIPEEDLKGYVYNVTVYELKRLFNVTGTSLFKMNVRNGLRRNDTGKELKRKFRNYLCTGLYKSLVESEGLEERENEIKDVLEINEDQIINNSIPKHFWFYHNGITIYAYDDYIDRTGNRIKINPSKVSVINGAQTLTNFFTEWDQLRHDVPCKMKEYFGIEEEKTIDILENVCKDISIKTICIEGKMNNVKSITNGLNTQIPIFKEDIMADNDIVKIINSHLMKGGMKILKSGEEDYNGEGLSVIDFVKKYLLIQNKPGRSKNLKKKEIEEILGNAKKEIEVSDEEIIFKLKMLNELEIWWKNTKNERNEIYVDSIDSLINSYGKSYFLSYALNETNETVENEYTAVLFDDFINTIKKIDANIKLETFKSDFLFEEYLKRKEAEEEKVDNNLELDRTDLSNLMDYLNKHEISKYTYAKEIATYLKKQNKEIAYFRVIRRFRDMEKGYFPKEAFPFPSTTFAEFYRKEDEKIEKEYHSFEDSIFGVEVKKEYPVFVLDFLYDEKRISKIENIEFIKKFSFSSRVDEAKEVYDQTVKAFEEGDDKLFTKVSDAKGFHIRPKATNSNDTFEFTNGMQITKRTFWANRETINDIILSLISAE